MDDTKDKSAITFESKDDPTDAAAKAGVFAAAQRSSFICSDSH
jgi:hypothetical protein